MRPGRPCAPDEAEGEGPGSVAAAQREIIESSPLPAVVHIDGEILAGSLVVAELVGLESAEELVGRSMFDFVADDWMDIVGERLTKLVAGRWPEDQVVGLRRADGEVIPAVVSSTPVSWGNRLASQIVVRPAIERRNWIVGHALAQCVAEPETEAVVVTDLQSRVLHWSHGARVLYWRSTDAAIGALVDDCVGAQDDATAALVEQAMSEGTSSGQAEHLDARGRPIAVRLDVERVHGPVGEPIGMTVVVRPRTADDDLAHLLQQIAAGIDAGEFVPHYQPIVDTDTGRVRKVEALARWQHPDRGLLTPAHFLSAIEETSLIESLGSVIIEAACHQVVAWRRDRPDLELAVNLSARQISRDDVVDAVLATIEEAGLPATALWVEITETGILEDHEVASRNVTAFRDAGVRVAIDDFGAGFAGLDRLRLYEVDALKIDRAFVHRIDERPGQQIIVRAMAALGRELGAEIVAEGVETEAQREAMIEVRCNHLQGYLFGRPVGPDPRPDWL